MMPMLIFLDTEFTDLKQTAKLISIGLVDETGTRLSMPSCQTPMCWQTAARSHKKSCCRCSRALQQSN